MRRTMLIVSLGSLLLTSMLWLRSGAGQAQFTRGNEYGMLATMQMANQQPVQSITRIVEQGSCTVNSETLCLNQNRFRVWADWKNYNDGSQGRGKAVMMTGDTGYFWFFNSANVELVLKVLDGRVINSYFWVMFGALSDVEYNVYVVDTATGIQKIYYNPPHQLASVADVNAFAGTGPILSTTTTVAFFPTTTTQAAGPMPGRWAGARNDFYVSADRSSVQRFNVITPLLCGQIWQITADPAFPTPISGNRFQRGGDFYFEGTFDSDTTAHGTWGLNNFQFLGGCFASISPAYWTATWQTNAQYSTTNEKADDKAGDRIIIVTTSPQK